MKKVVVVQIVSMILCGVCCGMGAREACFKIEVEKARVRSLNRRAAMDKTKADVARKLARPLVIKIASCSKQIECLLSQ